MEDKGVDEAVLEFTAEAREGLETLDAALVAYERAPQDPALLGDIFRVAHSLKGASGFLGLTRLQSLTHAMENVLGAFRDGELAASPDVMSLVLEALDRVRLIVDGLDRDGVEPQGDDAAMIARLDAVFAGAAAPSAEATTGAPAQSLLQRLGGEATLDAGVELACQRTLSGRVDLSDEDMERLRADLRTALTQAARGAGPLDAFQQAVERWLAGAPAEVRAALRPAVIAALIEMDAEPEAIGAVLPASAPAPTAPEVAPVSAVATPEPAVVRTIRVGVETLEHLMASASELVLIRNQLIQALRDQPDSPFAAPLHRLNQVTSELQEGVMATRMQPIAAAWAKLPRLTRDLAAELGKAIDLTLVGQDTELDRQVMELIKDPLNHLIRNAADHGLETPAERRAAGKPETGRLTLAARHEGGAIVIELTDDGRGLDLDRIRDKAVSSGLISAAEAVAMDAAQTARLIFAPGFSTAAQVSAVSGRGVGMDVVRANIERIGGTVDLNTTPGRGTRVVIRIPMTLSIVSALIVECGGERFALPQSAIVELVGAGAAEGRRIETMDGARVLRLRDRLLPLADLRQTLMLEAAEPDAPEACIVVARVGGFTFGVVVDRVFDTEEIVVKPLAGPLRRLRLYSGATILGDGAVVMILDAKGLAEALGAGELEEAALAESVSGAQGETGETLLLFRSSAEALWGAPLASVVRIEEVRPDTVERIDGRTVTQYHGRLMPLVQVDGSPADADMDTPRPLLVFADGDRLVGVPADEIVDIAQADTASDLPAATAGVAGSVIVAGRAVSLLDVDGLWGPRAAPTKDADPIAAERRPTLLVVDDSPFTQMMIRPLLIRAGYAVEVAQTPEAALALHEAGRAYDLILADTTRRGSGALRLAEALGRAERWRDTPLLGLGVQAAGAARGAALLEDVAGRLDERAA